MTTFVIWAVGLLIIGYVIILIVLAISGAIQRPGRPLPPPRILTEKEKEQEIANYEEFGLQPPRELLE
jgi:hypothetical protein